MEQTLNTRFLVLSLAALLLAGGGYFAAHAVQVRAHAGALLNRASRAEEQGRPDRATLVLNQYLLLRPDDTAARLRLGMLLDRTAQSPAERRSAAGVFEAVLASEPDRHDVRRRLAARYVELRDYSSAQEHLRVLREAFPQDAELEILAGQCHEAVAAYREASEAYKKAIRYAPDRTSTYARLANVLRYRLEKAADADATMDAMVRANPKDFRAFLERADYRQGLRRLPEAAQDVAQALRLAPQNADVLLTAGDLAHSQRDLPAAQNHLRRALELYPADERFYQASMALALEGGNLKEAVACLRRGLKQSPGHAEMLWNLAALLVDTGEVEEAGRIMGQLEAAGYAPVRLDFLGACILLKEGKASAASAALERLRPTLGDTPSLLTRADLLLGRCYEGLADFNRQLAASRRVVGRDPLSASGRAGIVSALLHLGRQEEALAECERLTRLPDAPPADWITLARLLIAQNFRAAARQQRWDLVEQALTRAAQALPGSVDVPLLAAEAAAARREWPQARRILEQARDRYPDRTEPWIALAGIAALEGGHPQAILDAAEKQFGLRVELRLAQVSQALDRSAAEGAQALARAAQELPRLAGEDHLRLLGGLAEGYQRARNYPEARRLGWQLAQAQLDNLNVRMVLFDWALEAGDEDGMRQALAGMREIEGPDGVLSHYCEACRLVRRARQGDTGLLGEAQAHLDAVKARRLDWSRATLCQAQIDQLGQKPELALANYLRAFALGARDVAAVRELVRLLYERGRYVEADQVLQQLPEEVTLREDLRRLAAQVYLVQRDFTRAVQLARKAVPADSKDYGELLWLGQILGASRSKDAEPVLRRAVALAPTVPDAWVALIQYLTRAGDLDKAVATLTEARGKLPAAQATLPLAQCYEAVGRTEEARAVYRAALDARPEDLATVLSAASFFIRVGPVAEARSLVRKIIDKKATAPTEKARALRLQALLAGEDAQSKREALVLLGLLGAQEPPASAGPGPRVEANAQAATQSVQRKLAQALELARRGRVGEALDLCDGAWEEGALELVASVSVRVLREAPAGEAELKRVERPLRDALRKHPEMLALRVCLANVCDLEGHNREAEMLYDQVLREDSRNLIAINNLAWLLAYTPGRQAEALELINRAINLYGPIPELLDTRAVVHLEAGHGDLALKDLQVADASPAGAAEVQIFLSFHLARAYHSAGSRGLAADHLNRARAAGLKPERLHPLERPRYETLVAALAVK
jgi:tetratricopeptide (TPR) repeat protein